MRSSPQVIGAARDQLRWTREQLVIEANGVGDNPIFLPDDEVVLTGANFQGTPVSMPLDTLGAAVTMVCVLSERRLNRLTNPALSAGLPPFLTKGAGMFSGLMLSQYTADMQIVEQSILSSPGLHPVDPGSGRPGGLRVDGHELGAQDAEHPRQRRTAFSASKSWRPRRDSISGTSTGARHPRRAQGGTAPRRVPRHRPPPLRGP